MFLSSTIRWAVVLPSKNMSTTFGKRLKSARKHAGLSQAALAKLVGMSQGSLSEAENGAASSRSLVQLAQACGVSPTWLASGEGEMIESQKKVSHGTGSNVTTAHKRSSVPLISWVQAGAWGEAQDMFQPGEADEWVDAYESDPQGRSFALRVHGDSMTSPHPGELSFPAGTVLIVDPDREAGAGDFVIAKDVDTNQATFKKLMHDGGRWFLKPLNPAYPTIQIDDPAIRVIGRVVESQTRRKL